MNGVSEPFTGSRRRVVPPHLGSTGYRGIISLKEAESARVAVKDTNIRRAVIIAAALASFCAAFMATSLSVALPQIGREFGMDAILLSWVITIYLLTVAVFSVPSGRIADIVGIKKTVIYGLVLYTASSLAAAFSVSSVMLLVCRVTQSVGGAMIVSNTIALGAAVYPASERGRAIGLVLAAVYVGASTGPFLGGVLTEHFGWRSVFLFNVPAGLITIALLVSKVKGEWCESKGEKFDYIGSIIYGASLTGIMYGVSLLPDAAGMVLILVGILLLTAFVKWESRTPNPVIHMSLFRNNKRFVLSNLAALINYSAIYAVAFLLSLYLQYIKGWTPEMSGFVLVVQPVAQAIGSPLSGKLSDRMEPGIVAAAGMALTGSGLLLLFFLTANTSVPQIVFALLLVGSGCALFVGPNTNAIMGSVAPKFYAVASATTSTMRSMGQMVSMGITMILMTVIIGRVAITPQYHPAFLASARYAFGIFTLLSVAGVFASLFRGKATKFQDSRSP